MKVRTSLLLQLAALTIAVLFSAYMAGHMPDSVPVHWNASGAVDQYGSKWLILLLMPAIMLAMVGLYAVLPKISPRNYKIDSFMDTYGYVFVLVAMLMLAIHVITTQASAGSPLNLNKLLMVVLFAFFALLGNVLGKVQQNFFVGIRTPWTISSERVWHATHRSAARLWFVGGLVGIVLALISAPFWLVTAYMILICLAPAVQSYFLYQKLEKPGQR